MYDQTPKVTLTVSRVSATQSRASIGESWTTSVSLIRPGYILTTNDGGKGLVYRVTPSFIYFTVLSAFHSMSYASGNWKLDYPQVSDVAKFLPELFVNTKLIPELFDELQRLVNDTDDSTLRLNYAKDYNNCDIGIIPNTLYDLGIDFYTEQTTPSILKRMLQESVPYNQYSGELRSLDYIGIAFNAQLEFIQLWTLDYKNFYEYGALPYDNRDQYYPTNYIRIRYTKSNKDLDTETIRQIFYKLAWVCNVIYDIELGESFEDRNIYVNSAAVPCFFIAFKSPDQTIQDTIDFVYGDVIPMPTFTP